MFPSVVLSYHYKDRIMRYYAKGKWNSVASVMNVKHMEENEFTFEFWEEEKKNSKIFQNFGKFFFWKVLCGSPGEFSHRNVLNSFCIGFENFWAFPLVSHYPVLCVKLCSIRSSQMNEILGRKSPSCNVSSRNKLLFVLTLLSSTLLFSLMELYDMIGARRLSSWSLSLPLFLYVFAYGCHGKLIYS